MNAAKTGAIVAVLLLTLASCATMGELGAVVGQATGTLNADQADSVRRTGQTLEKSFEDITPEQEYYIGRAVGATVLDQYAPYPERGANDYLNLLGQSLALLSDRPATFAGYHFLFLDSEEINAFAAPSGFVFVTLGMMRLAEGEDEAAAIVAHEIAHVAAQHGLKAIKKSRITAALTSAALTTASIAGPEELAQLTQTFDDSILDITTTMINKGYSREFEREADSMALEILERAGYDPRALVRVLEVMDRHVQSGGPGFGKTHPDPTDRVESIEAELRGTAATAGSSVRDARYRRAMAGILEG